MSKEQIGVSDSIFMVNLFKSKLFIIKTMKNKIHRHLKQLSQNMHSTALSLSLSERKVEKIVYNKKERTLGNGQM